MVQEVRNVQELADQLLPTINDQSVVSLKFNRETAKMELVGANQLIDELAQRADFVKKFVYQESDRQEVRKLRAAVNKLKKSIQAEIRAQKTHIFDDVDDQKSEMFNYLDSIINSLDQGMDHFDQELKKQKRQQLVDQFNHAKESIPELAQTDLQFEDVMNHQWLNRSFADTKALKEMTSRLDTLQSLINSPVLTDQSLDDLLEACQYQSWDGLQAQNYLLEQIQKAKEEAARKKAEAELQAQMERDRQAEIEQAEREAKEQQKELLEQANDDYNNSSISIDESTLVSIKIKEHDRQQVVDLLTKAGIWFEEE